eukprot:271267_1
MYSPTRDTSKYTQPQHQRIVIWQKLIKRWNPLDEKLVKCAQSMTKYTAIPTSLRAKAWFVISGASELLRTNSQLYHKLYSLESHDIDLIERDLKRTTFYDKTESSSLPHCLRRILIAYSNFDRTLGYCQGMNYIAAFLLHVFKAHREECAFWTFVVIMRQIRSLFMDGLPGFHKVVYYFRRLCEYHLPKLYKTWESQGVDVFKLILTKWFHCLFSYRCVDCEHTARIWDLFLTHDFSVCVQFAFALIAYHKSKLSRMDLVDISEWCDLLHCMKHKGNELIQKSICLKLNNKYLKYTRDLTQFDWQINKSMKKEYIRQKQKKERRYVEKQLEPSATFSTSSVI